MKMARVQSRIKRTLEESESVCVEKKEWALMKLGEKQLEQRTALPTMVFNFTTMKFLPNHERRIQNQSWWKYSSSIYVNQIVMSWIVF